MARNRSIRFRKRRPKSEAMEIDITSLLDILVILLVFLLKSYNSSGVVLNVPKGIELPTSTSSSLNTAAVIIQVSADKIYVDDRVILDTANLPDKTYDEGGRRIVPLFNELVKKKDEIKLLEKSSDQAKKFSGKINMVVDKKIKYSYLKKLMYTSATAGYKSFKFVVMGEEQ